MLEYIVPHAIAIVSAALVVGIGSMGVRWVQRVDRGLSDTVKSAELLRERLNGHEKLDDERHIALEGRLDDIADRLRWDGR